MIKTHSDFFDPLERNMRKASMSSTIQEYVAMTFFGTLIVLIASLIVTFIFVALLLPTLFGFTLAILITGLATGLSFGLFYYYPSILAKGLKTKIERSLPFAVFYMTTTASSGVNSIEIFKMLSLRGGVVGNEAKKIYTNVKTLGMSLTGALQRSASKTPSNQFSDLLWGMSSVMSSGGNLEEYLLDKTRSFMAQYIRTLNEYSKQISLYTEIYITLIIVGTLFFIILLAIMSPIIGLSVLLLQAFMVFFLIPAVSIGFIILLKTISPLE